MLPAERYRLIEQLVGSHELVTIEQLQHKLGVSRATVYRDAHALDSQGRAQIVRGGIARVRPPEPISNDQPYEEKTRLNAAEKERIAAAAARMIKNGMTVLLDSSTTVFGVCAGLKRVRDVCVITNDIRIAAALTGYTNLSVFVIGGVLRQHYYTLLTQTTGDSLDKVTADIGFFSCDAFTAEHGCMITNSDEIYTKKKMLELCMQRVLLCDHSKLGRTAFMSFAPISEMDRIIIGQETPDATFQLLSRAGSDVVRV